MKGVGMPSIQARHPYIVLLGPLGAVVGQTDAGIGTKVLVAGVHYTTRHEGERWALRNPARDDEKQF